VASERGLWAAWSLCSAPTAGHQLHGVVPAQGPPVGPVAGCVATPPGVLDRGWQLLIELAHGLGEFIEARPALGVCGMIVWCQFRVSGAT
jgi:hypothetical protein